MKKQILILATACMVMVAMAVPAFAQTKAIKVNIPFVFNVDDKAYSAGEYVFTAEKENIVVIEKDGRNRLGLFLANHIAGSDNTKSEVHFQCYDSSCFVSQVWIPGKNDGFQPFRSKAEKELATKAKGKYLALMGTPADR
jgi:hypothetical protein